jgi:hypothetical protein
LESDRSPEDKPNIPIRPLYRPLSRWLTVVTWILIVVALVLMGILVYVFWSVSSA